MKAICAIGDDATAQQYLDAANGSLEDAINNYMAAAGDAPPQVAAAAPVRPSANHQGMAGMGSLMAEDPDDEGRQEYYAGGASSGAAILDPKKKEAPSDIFKRLQEAAEAQGPDGEDDDMTARPDPRQYEAKGHDWGSSGYSLGGEGKESGPVGGGASAGGAAAAAAPAAKKHLSKIVITRYSDGFTLDEGDGEGDLRRPDVPENAIFLQDLERNQVPMELRERVKNGNLDVALSDKQGEPAPAPKFKAFAGGSGQSMGSAAAEEKKAAIAAAAAAAPATSWEGANESMPTTKLQIRLHDGQRLVASFNHTQTVGDIRAFINSSNPGMAAAAYTLATTFPRKVLSDTAATIEGEGLLNGVVVQSL